MNDGEREDVRVGHISFESDNMMYLHMQDGRNIGLDCKSLLKVKYNSASPIETVDTGARLSDAEKLCSLEARYNQLAQTNCDLIAFKEKLLKASEAATKASTELREQLKFEYENKLKNVKEDCQHVIDAQFARAVSAEASAKREFNKRLEIENKYNLLLERIKAQSLYLSDLSKEPSEANTQKASADHIQTAQPIYR